MREGKADLLIAVPTRGTVRAEWAAMLTGLAMPVNFSQMLRVIPGKTVVEARNVAVEAALKEDAHYLLFLDDDTLMPNQSVTRMIYQMENNPTWDLISGIVPTKTDPPEPCIFKEGHPGAYWGWTFNETFEIDACGMAACLIRVESIRRMVPEPWFTWVQTSDGLDKGEQGEDLGFCHTMRQNGGILKADGGILCGHMDPEGKVYSLDVDTAPFHRAGNETLRKFKVLT